MSTNLGSKDGVLIRIMKVSDYPELKNFMGKNFFNSEPLCASSGENVQRHHEEENDKYHISMIEQGTCLLALDETQPGRIVGFVLAGAQYPSDLEKHRKEAMEMEQNVWGRICVLLSKVEIDANVFERYKAAKALYSHITNVHTSMRGKGLGGRLAAALMEVGRQQGFPLMIAYCTSYYSARQKESLGMECVYSLAYADYKNDKGEVVFKPEAPHTHLRLMLIKL
ncbi:CG9486 [Drosophila busckii]|uniref:aralkylamine N-acetyltransferase n=1 Tax=Drosophila busckii TaxID=30019 RepID=A0A0M4E6V5_DROBS|nr:CG9486 [Drosophila busckii]